MVLERLRDKTGQATVELMIVLPVAIVVAAIGMNALLFLGDCAAFDRSVPQIARVCASSASYGQTQASCVGEIQRALDEQFDEENVSTQVTVTTDYAGNAIYAATLRFTPTLFGLGLRTEILGVSLPSLTHTTYAVYSPYRPAVIA